MKTLVDFLREFRFEVYILILAISIGLFMAVPKKHQGYYVERLLGETVPVFSVVNDFSWWPDTTVYISTDINEVLRVKDELERRGE